MLDYSVDCTNANASGNKADGSDKNVSSGLSAQLTIPKLVRLTTASPATINFSNFTTSTQQVQVSIKSTSTINVAVTTTNGGKLVRSGAPAPYPTNSTIAYNMTYNGNLIAPGGTLSNQTRGGVSGTNFPLVLTLTGGVPSGKLAGTYSDTITLSVTPGL